MGAFWTNPLNIAVFLVIPAVVIGLAKSWMKLKDKAAEKQPKQSEE